MSVSPTLETPPHSAAPRIRPRTYPYLSAPLAIYLIVMLPICGLEFFLIVTNSPGWMRVSAGVVLLATFWGFLRGYVRRVTVADDAIRMTGIFGHIRIPWDRVRRIDTYTPAGPGTTNYVYITTKETPPAGKWDIDADTIQLQDRPALIASMLLYLNP